MYNRYVPRPDGSYSKKTVQEPTPTPRQSSPPPRQEEYYAPPPPPRQEQGECEHTPPPRHNSPGANPWDFLRRLLPRDFDTGDLLIILLLLLMAGDCNDDKNTALLTLALYLFM